MKAAFFKFMRDERGATAIEYGIIAGLIAVVLATAFGAGPNSIALGLNTVFTKISTTLAPAATGSATSGSSTPPSSGV